VSSENNPTLGTGLGEHALRLSGRIVAGVGQLLLWILRGVGAVLRPPAVRLGGWLYGRKAPKGGYARESPGGTRILPPDETGMAPLPRWVGMWKDFAATWWFAPLTGVALTLAALAELQPHGRGPVSIAGGFAVATTLPLVWRREYLRPVSAVVLGAFAAGLFSGQQLLITSALAALYTFYSLGRHLDRQSTAVLAVASTLGLLPVYAVSNSLNDIPAIAAILAVIAAIGLGDARRVVETASRTEAAAQERNSETLTRLGEAQREQAVLRERARIARELHDVVAHSVSMIAVQAETAPYTMHDLSPEASEGFKEIAGTAREALVEMRRLLGVLRADARVEQPDTAPQPRLDRLPDLIEKHRGAGGGAAEIAVAGNPRVLSATIELSAYRIVQEALTNARRHAPGSRVRVELTYLPDRLAVRVRDDGGPGGSGATRVFGPEDVGHGGHGGHGLLGMRERATMLGGHFAAGPATHGGFMVEAELPTKTE
jgi:signal transduction histidine kinase